MDNIAIGDQILLVLCVCCLILSLSVRISSRTQYNTGLFILDLDRAPWGCGVWPAWWTVGPNWPSGGEIDIIEGVHEQATNQMTLHTSAGCTLNTKPPGNLAFTSTILGTQCASSNSNNDGCAFSDDNSNSYGQGLANAGGGVFAMLWDDSGVKICQFISL